VPLGGLFVCQFVLCCFCVTICVMSDKQINEMKWNQHIALHKVRWYFWHNHKTLVKNLQQRWTRCSRTALTHLLVTILKTWAIWFYYFCQLLVSLLLPISLLNTFIQHYDGLSSYMWYKIILSIFYYIVYFTFTFSVSLFHFSLQPVAFC